MSDGRTNIEESRSRGLRICAACINLAGDLILDTCAAFLHVCIGYPEVDEDAT